MTLSAFQRGARSLGLGKLALYTYYRPIGLARHMILDGGPIEQIRTRRGRLAMRAAAELLPELVPPTNSYPITVKFLSGEKFWDQTVFCITSLQQNADCRIDPVVYDDGTLSKPIQDLLRRVVPWVRFVLADEIADRLETRLPEKHYPALRARRAVYPHLRKLTDLHDPGHMSLVLDSDMLFFRRPDALLTWMVAPNGVIYMQDAERSYGYSDILMSNLAHGAVPERMNVGLYGMSGDLVDFDYLERYCREMITQEGASYLQEQAMTALLVSGKDAIVLPREDYHVMPHLTEGRNPTAALHHYVAHSKRSYFQYGWKKVWHSATAKGE